MSEPTINEKFQTLLPPLLAEEYNQLEESILAHGVKETIKVWRGQIVDGHNRFSICKKHDLTYPVKDVYFADEDAALEWILTNQLGRRNLTANQKTIFIGELYELRKKNVGEHKGNQYTNFGIVQNLHNSKAAEINTANFAQLADADELTVEYDEDYGQYAEPETTAESIAKQFGVSPRTVHNAAKVVEKLKGDDELTRQFLEGKIKRRDLLETVTPATIRRIAEKEAITTDAGARWRDSTNKIYTQIASIVAHGGIENLAGKWSSANQTKWRDELRRLSGIFDTYADQLEELINE